MERYKINKSLKKSILSKKRSLRELSKKLDFEVRNILYKNSTIPKENLEKLERYLNKKFFLKRVYLNYGKNISPKIYTEKINKIRRNGDLAEFIGIMLGDGNIWNNRIRIAFDKRNLEYVRYVSKLFKKLFGIKLNKEINKNTNQLYLYRTNLYAIEELLKQGLMKGDKIKNAIEVPSWIKSDKFYSKRCIRGLIDTDGCVYWSKRDRQIYIKFTNFNLQLLGDFKKITDNLGYSFAKANKNNWCLYRKKEVARFIKEINPLKSRGRNITW